MDKNHFLIALSESDRTDFGRVEFSEQSSPQKVFSAIWELESKVNFGGFDSLFRSSGPKVIAFFSQALSEIGAYKCQSIVERAVDLFLNFPVQKEEHQKAFEKLDALDQRFLAYPDNLTELLFAFVQRHPAAFGTVPGDLA